MPNPKIELGRKGKPKIVRPPGYVRPPGQSAADDETRAAKRVKLRLVEGRG